MQRIAIIGGGASGAAVMAEFLRRSDRLRLSWLVGRCAPGRGVAYGTSSPFHLLNVRAANMGLFADDAGALIRFLHDRKIPARPGDFVPRFLFGDYVEETLNQLLAARSTGLDVDICRSEAIALEQRADGGYLIHTDDQNVLAVDGVVVAIGALPPVPIAQVQPEAIESGRYLPDAWQSPELHPAPQRVVVLGSGLTAVDVILTAANKWPEAQIVALSRHGRLPAAHRAEPGAPYGYQSELIELLRADGSIRKWVGLVREAVNENISDWRAIVDGLRPVTMELWRSLDDRQRRRFLRHVRWAWETVRHRMPPQTAQAVELLRDQGRLAIVAGRIRRIEGHSPLTLTYRRRDDGATEVIGADLVIQATGLQTAVKRTSHPLLQQMFQAGLVRADSQGLGVVADPHGRVTNADGKVMAGMRVVGTLLRGVLWECTAIPEIRMMAARLVRELPGELRQTATRYDCRNRSAHE